MWGARGRVQSRIQSRMNRRENLKICFKNNDLHSMAKSQKFKLDDPLFPEMNPLLPGELRTGQQPALHARDGLSLWELACKRIVPVNGHCHALTIAGRPAPTREFARANSQPFTRVAVCLCGSLPASESCRSTGISTRQQSPAGRLLQGSSHRPTASPSLEGGLSLWELACKRIVPRQTAPGRAARCAAVLLSGAVAGGAGVRQAVMKSKLSSGVWRAKLCSSYNSFKTVCV